MVRKRPILSTNIGNQARLRPPSLPFSGQPQRTIGPPLTTRSLPDRSSRLQPSPVSVEAAQGRDKEGLCVRAGAFNKKQLGTYDESELCKLLLEISLLDSAH